jgi:hypothetical protein
MSIKKRGLAQTFNLVTNKQPFQQLVQSTYRCKRSSRLACRGLAEGIHDDHFRRRGVQNKWILDLYVAKRSIFC